MDLSKANEASESTKGYESSSGYLRAIIDSLEDELLVVDKDYRIVEANDSVLRRYSKHEQGVIGSYCYEVSHRLTTRCSPPSHECPIQAVWETGKPARVIHPLTDE